MPTGCSHTARSTPSTWHRKTEIRISQRGVSNWRTEGTVQSVHKPVDRPNSTGTELCVTGGSSLSTLCSMCSWKFLSVAWRSSQKQQCSNRLVSMSADLVSDITWMVQVNLGTGRDTVNVTDKRHIRRCEHGVPGSPKLGDVEFSSTGSSIPSYIWLHLTASADFRSEEKRSL
jgi:hypothetical protein